MYDSAQRLSTTEVQELRREGGRLLRRLREARGLSQRELCARVGGGVYTFISQLETGRGRIPPDKLRAWGEALGLEARTFATMILPYYDPETFAILFPDASEPADRGVRAPNANALQSPTENVSSKA